MKVSNLVEKAKELIREFFEMMALGNTCCQISAHSTLVTFNAYY